MLAASQLRMRMANSDKLKIWLCPSAAMSTPPMDIATFQAASFVSSSQIFENDDGDAPSLSSAMEYMLEVNKKDYVENYVHLTFPSNLMM